MSDAIHPRVAHLLTLPAHAQRSEAWFEQRRGRITASEVASVLDIKPFATYSAYGGHPRRELLLRKAYPEREEFKFAGNNFTAHGTENETVALKKYEQMTGRKILEFGFVIHETIPWLGASPDGITTDGILIEVKCPLSRRLEYDAEGVAKVPSHYLPQILHSLEVYDLEVCDFVQLRTAGLTWPHPEEFTVTRVTRDRDWFARVLPELVAFKEELAAGVPLPPEPKPRAKRRKLKQPVCEIHSDDEREDPAADDPTDVAAVAAAVTWQADPLNPLNPLNGVVLQVHKDIVKDVEEGKGASDAENADTDPPVLV